MSQDNVAIRAENVSKVYRLRGASKDSSKKQSDFYALKHVSFEIKKGESWGFVGVNGSGKSTLLKIISGNLRLSAGRVEVDGKVAILDYSSGLNGDFTGKENIFIKAGLLGLTKKQIQERLQSIIDFAEIGDFIHQPVRTYSSGMVSRLGFAIMAHVDADILITDEALAVGDVFFVQKCMQFIRSFLKKGTFLFVSHSVNDVLSLCQHAVWLEHGVIKAIGSAPSVTQAYLDQKHLEFVNHLTQEQAQPLQPTPIAEKVCSDIVIEQPILSQLMDYQFFSDSNATEANNPNINLYNEMVIEYDTLIKNAGIGGASITKVALYDQEGLLLERSRGGEQVVLAIQVFAHKELKSPIMGFQVIDRLGQVIFADNSALVTKNKTIIIKMGTTFVAEFAYEMPFLPIGNYTMRIAIATGEEEGNAILLETINQALTLRSVLSNVKQGLIGVAMRSIDVEAKVKDYYPFSSVDSR